LPLLLKTISVPDLAFSGFRNLRYSELPDSRDLDQLVQQEIFIPGFLHVLDNRNESLSLFLPAQTTLAQDDQSRVNRRVEKFDEVSCVRRDNGKVMIKRILPDRISVRPARPACGTDWEYTPTSANSRTSAGEMFSSSRKRIMR
jgi:hypothetical protein